MKTKHLLIACAIAAWASAFPAISQTTKFTPPTIEDVWRLPQFEFVGLAPNGQYVAALAPSKGRMNLVIIDLEKRSGNLITSYENFDVKDVRWVGNERLVFSLGERNTPVGESVLGNAGGLYTVQRDGSAGRMLAQNLKEALNTGQRVYRGMRFSRLIPNVTNEIIVEGNLTAADSNDLYRLNLDTGRTTLITSGRPDSRTNDWLLDNKLVPRVVSAQEEKGDVTTVYYRAGADAKWEEIAKYDRYRGDKMIPLAVGGDGKTLFVASNKGRDTMAVYRYDASTKQLGEMLASHPRFDMGLSRGSISDEMPGITLSDDDKVEGFTVAADKPETVWLDEKQAATQKTIDSALPDTINSFVRAGKSGRVFITAFSDVKPARWYLLDEVKKTLEEIGAARPWLDGKLPQQRPIRIKSRDGLEIPGYLFLPPDYKEGTKLPTIIHVHGGPMVRADFFGRGFGVNEGRLFATRGYAVVLPNFRITPGLGRKVYESGLGTIGRAMSEDHEDALQWAIDQGFADPKRACISGASYGGYAALRAMVKTPDLFKCAIAGLAVTDLDYQNTSTDTDYVRTDRGDNQYWKQVIGVKDFSEAITREMSPVNYATKIKGAVFLYAGRDDARVPIKQIDRMDKALRDAGNPAKAYVIKEREGHGFSKPENRVDLYSQVLKFLEEQIGK